MNEERRYLLFYDISSAKTYRQVVKAIDRYHHIRIQKSLYEIMLDMKEHETLSSKLIKICKDSNVSIVLVALSESDYKKVLHYGKSPGKLDFSANFFVV